MDAGRGRVVKLDGRYQLDVVTPAGAQLLDISGEDLLLGYVLALATTGDYGRWHTPEDYGQDLTEPQALRWLSRDPRALYIVTTLTTAGECPPVRVALPGSCREGRDERPR